MSTPGGPGRPFPPLVLKLGNSTWTRQNPHSTVSAVYQCPEFSTFHITLILGTPLESTSCSQVHATPNLPAFKNLHVWYGGTDNFHPGAGNLVDLSKTSQTNALDWYRKHRSRIADLLDTAYHKLWAAKNAAYPAPAPPPAPAKTAAKSAPTRLDAAQKRAEQTARQHQTDVLELERDLVRVRELLAYTEANFPDARPGPDETVEFVHDYHKWSAPLDKLVTVWTVNQAEPNRIPDRSFKSLLAGTGLSDLRFLFGTLKHKGRVAYSVPAGECSRREFEVSDTDPVVVALRRQEKKLTHIERNPVRPAGYAERHVYLVHVGGVVPAEGWYAFDAGDTQETALEAALEFKLVTGELPRCVVCVDEDAFCPIELLTFVGAGDLKPEQSGKKRDQPVPPSALTAWAETLPEASYDSATRTVTVEGLRFALDGRPEMLMTTDNAADARKKYRIPAYFLRAKGRKAFFDMAKLTPPDPEKPLPEQLPPVGLPRARYDSGTQLLIWQDNTTFPLPRTVLDTLEPVSAKTATADRCVQLSGGKVIRLLDLYQATPTCTVIGRLGELLVVETATGVRVATHVLPACETCDDTMVMDGDFIGWINDTVAYPLRDYLLHRALVIPDCEKLRVLTDADDRTWWQVKVQGTDCWVGEDQLQHLFTTTFDELQLFEWVRQSQEAGIVLIVDDDGGVWLANTSSLTTEEPPGVASPSPN
ncbi:hypothetical protein OHS18_06090 [Amycolatopsis sp. NBC_00355]|uniref:hypothetical protein n=1 Tax=Amycolatopsis sp. NBC_00355 TaxID=2975957 RepID=UPI002E2682BB